MLSADQIDGIERIYFRRDYVPAIQRHLLQEGLGELDSEKEDRLCDLHIGLRRLWIFSPRNTFRLVRLMTLTQNADKVDQKYIAVTLMRTGMNENRRFETLERNILAEDNSARWRDLE